jgi:hypothetical protein
MRPTTNTARTKAGDTKIDVLRHAITQVRVAEYAATGIVVNPNDWDDIETQKDDNGRYIWANVNLGGEQRMWRLPVIDTNAMPEGEFMVGAFSPAAQIFDREDASVVVSSEDQDNFVKNMVTILVEERLVQCDLSAGVLGRRRLFAGQRRLSKPNRDEAIRTARRQRRAVLLCKGKSVIAFKTWRFCHEDEGAKNFPRQVPAKGQVTTTS